MPSNPSRARISATPILGVIVVLMAVAAPAHAQGGFGLRGGATLDPDQGFLGMHFVTGPLAGSLRMQPGADVGFGDDVVLAALHIDLAQWIELNPRWHLYFGGGPAVNIYRFETTVRGGDGESFTEVEGGFDTLVGFAHDTGWMFEMRVGSSGSPDLRFAVGFTFK
jgi:hypothetical protein